jgi:hypothetical protein
VLIWTWFLGQFWCQFTAEVTASTQYPWFYCPFGRQFSAYSDTIYCLFRRRFSANSNTIHCISCQALFPFLPTQSYVPSPLSFPAYSIIRANWTWFLGLFGRQLSANWEAISYHYKSQFSPISTSILCRIRCDFLPIWTSVLWLTYFLCLLHPVIMDQVLLSFSFFLHCLSDINC